MTTEYYKSLDEKPAFLKHSVMGTVRRVIMYLEMDKGRWGFAYPEDLGIPYIDQWEPSTEQEYNDYKKIILNGS